MPAIDSQGRLFGRVNLIDAIVALVLFALVPLAYGAYVLFRTPTPTITSVTPTRMIHHRPVTLRIQGQDLRPYLRAHLGGSEGAFLLQSPMVAEVKVPDLAPGTYDLVLFDEGQELLRQPAALTVVPVSEEVSVKPWQVELELTGRFIGLTADRAKSIHAGSKFEKGPETAEVVASSPPESYKRRLRVGREQTIEVPVPGESQVRAVLHITCVVTNDQCIMGDGVIAADGILALPDALKFEVASVRLSPAKNP